MRVGEREQNPRASRIDRAHERGRPLRAPAEKPLDPASATAPPVRAGSPICVVPPEAGGWFGLVHSPLPQRDDNGSRLSCRTTLDQLRPRDRPTTWRCDQRASKKWWRSASDNSAEGGCPRARACQGSRRGGRRVLNMPEKASASIASGAGPSAGSRRAVPWRRTSARLQHLRVRPSMHIRWSVISRSPPCGGVAPQGSTSR